MLALMGTKDCKQKTETQDLMGKQDSMDSTRSLVLTDTLDFQARMDKLESRGIPDWKDLIHMLVSMGTQDCTQKTGSLDLMERQDLTDSTRS